MNCAEAKLKLEPCVAGTLAPDERIQLEEHLAMCEGCRLELELTRAVMGAPHSESADGPSAPGLEAVAPSPVEPAPRTATGSFDEASFADLASEAPAAGPAPPLPAEHAGGPGEMDPFANVKAKPPDEPPAATWDFEPADVPRDSSPPENSLSFAHEALRLRREAEERRKSAFVRIALWGGGIGCGLVLLGISVWIALAFRQEKPPEFPPSGGSSPSAPQNETATPAPPDPSPVPSVSGGGEAPPPATPDPSASTTAPAPPVPAAPATQAPDAPVPTILDATPGVAPTPKPPVAKVASRGPTKSASATTRAKPGAKGAANPSSGSTARKTGSAEDEGEFPWMPVDDPPALRPGDPETTLPMRPAPVRPPASAPPEQGTQPPGGPEAPSGGTAATASSPKPPDEPPPQAAEKSSPQAPEPTVTKPIDRLHLATESAAKEADLDALRKLRSRWKSLVGSTAGPDRARAKREYADCLWSIQELSGRNSDRRAALVAYRDYVLYAPAGGADSRTIGRMRFLEDVLTDSK